MCMHTHPVARDTIESAVGVVVGTKPRMISMLYFLLYTHSAGGTEAMVDTNEGCAEEFRINVRLLDLCLLFFIREVVVCCCL